MLNPLEDLSESAMTLQWQTLAFTELTREEMYAVLRLRQEVFVVEQRCAYLDLDDLDQQATHMLCMQDRELLAYQRCLAPGLSYPESSLGRIVVCPARRGLNLGRELVQRGIEHNLSQWPRHDIRINAQAQLQDFYTSLGFTAEGGEYLEDNILHRQMRYQARRTTSELPKYPTGR
jgi:ElaA protein